MLESGKSLWLCLWFYELPLDALRNDSHALFLESAANDNYADRRGDLTRNQRPLAVLEKQRVVVANPAATVLGVAKGMGTSTARALAENIRLLERDTAAEQRCLQRLCCWAYSVSPTLYPLRDHSLMLEVGSCLRLYGGLEVLLARVRRELVQRGYSYRLGLGPTPKSAELFSIRPLEGGAKENCTEGPGHREGFFLGPLEGGAKENCTEGPGHREGFFLGPLEGVAKESCAEALDHREGFFLGPLESVAKESCAEALSSRPLEGGAKESRWEGLFIEPLEGGAKESRWEGLSSRPLGGGAKESCAEALDRQEEFFLGPLEERLGPLPLKLLVDFPRQVDALARAGLWTFGDILAMPQQALARRCGPEFVHYLNQILGMAEDIGEVFEPPQVFLDHYWFGYEVKANQELLPAVELLLQALCQFLRHTQLQTQELTWLLYGINRKVHSFSVCSSLPHTHWQAWYQLTRLKIDQISLTESIEGIGLESHDLVAGQHHSEDLFQQAGQKEPLHCLLDRLKSRLGLQSVNTIACRDEHLPEFAGYCSLEARPTQLPADANGELRPFWLMQKATQLKEHGGVPCWNGRLILLDGPERIEDNWWENAVSRDYYIARDGAGQQYWVYRDRIEERWYLQGFFS
ncbi:MAG: DNA polymerase Y family protein [Pseudomonadota bacterium]